MIRGFVAAGALALGLFAATGAVVAQNDPIAQRKAVMKAIGDAGRAPAAMLKGEAPFSLPAVQAALTAMQNAGKQGPALFPETSKTGGDTASLPKIWENKADFNAKLAKMDADATAAQTKIVDEASFKATYPELLKNCGGCHQDYRAKR
jgi:cytochrome c556